MPSFFLLTRGREDGGLRVPASVLAGVLGHSGGRGVGQKDEESEGVLFPIVARAEVERGGLATRAGGRRATAALGRRPGGAVAVKGRGKSERGPWGFDSPAHLGRRHPVDGPPRRRDDVGGGSNGSGTAGLGSGRAAVEGLRWPLNARRGSIYRPARAGRRAGRGGRPVSSRTGSNGDGGRLGHLLASASGVVALRRRRAGVVGGM